MHELAIGRGEKVPETATFPEATIKDGLDFSKPHEEATKAAEEFIILTEKHAKYNLPWKEQEKIRERMDSIAEGNLKYKAFFDTIEKSGSKAALDRLNLETYTREIAMNRDRGKGDGYVTMHLNGDARCLVMPSQDFQGYANFCKDIII